MTKIRHWSTLQLSSRIFYTLVTITLTLFALFRTIGYDMPYDENPGYNAPLLTGFLVWFMLALIVGTMALMAWSMIHGIRMNSTSSRIINHIPARLIATIVSVGTMTAFAICFALSDTTPVKVNGASYTDGIWLRTSGMFVGTSMLMIAVAVIAVIFGATRHIRN